jgi:hypothetical protein
MIRPRNLRYAYEREDRLGNLYGVDAVGVLPRRPHTEGEEAMSVIMETLYSRFEQMDTASLNILRGILGSTRLDDIRRALEARMRKKEDAEEGIRILGMLLQTIEWTEANRLLIKGSDSLVCFYHT